MTDRKFSPWRRSPLESRFDHVLCVTVMGFGLVTGIAGILYGLWGILTQ